MIKIAIHGVPRSGTTWLGEIFNSSPHVCYKYQPLFSYTFKGWLTDSSKRSDVNDFFRVLYECGTDDFLDQVSLRRNGSLPAFVKSEATHVAYKEVRYHYILWNMVRNSPDVKFVFLLRNPMAVVNSWLNAPKEFRKDLGWQEAEEWRYALKKNTNRPEEYNGYEKWKDAVQMFKRLRQQYSDRVCLVSYRELITDPIGSAECLFRFCNLELGSQTLEFLSPDTLVDPVRRHAYGAYNTKTDDYAWRETLDSNIRDAILSDLEHSGMSEALDW